MNLRMVVPVQIAVVALLVGSYFAYLAVRGSDEDRPAASASASGSEPERLVSAKGGFAIGVPDGVTATKDGRTVTLRTQDKALVVVVGPIGSGALSAGADAFIRSLKVSYTEVRVLRSEKQRVDGRDALATSGEAVNSRKVPIRFVSLAVKARPRNVAITTFAAADADPADVLPITNAIVSRFEVL